MIQVEGRQMGLQDRQIPAAWVELAEVGARVAPPHPVGCQQGPRGGWG